MTICTRRAACGGLRGSACSRLLVGRQHAVPSRAVGVAPVLTHLAQPVPSAMLDLHAGGRIRELVKDDRHIGRVLRVGGDVPPIAQAPRRFPLHDLAPLDLLASGGPLEDPPADPRLEDDLRAALMRDGVLRRPPGRGLAGPGLEGVVRAAFDLECDPERLDQRLRGVLCAAVSAKRLKPVATSFHTWVRYLRSTRYSRLVPTCSSETSPALFRMLRCLETAGRLMGRRSAISCTERGWRGNNSAIP